ncbi:MAG: DegT/DnrJ/EryC1/StrS family aminotransferase [Acidobacteriia bacterium]|nr:DegT/DnrJ/EryC1/StrS family aminotransferase [Terriglobia bacterium]
MKMSLYPIEIIAKMALAQPSSVPRLPGIIGTYMGRDALSLAASYLNLSSGDTVLLPLYTCQELLQPFLRKYQVVFYDVSPDLTIDPNEIQSRIGERRIRLMLLTNYFGFLQPYRKEIRHICATKGVSLIEDCAHSLLTEGSGETGDMAIYSFRKIVPLPDGGGLKINVDGNWPEPSYHPNIYSTTLSLAIMAKKLCNIRTKALSRGQTISRLGSMLSDSRSPHKTTHILPLSYFARTGMSKACFSDIIEKRRSDFEVWLRVCKEVRSIAPVFETIPLSVCPVGFPVRVKQRDILEARLGQKGVFLPVHWRLDPTIGLECGTSHQLTKEMLTLPVYPDLGPRTREVITHTLEEGWES